MFPKKLLKFHQQFHHIKATNESRLAQISLTEDRNNFRIGLAGVRASANKYREQLDTASEYQTFLSDRTIQCFPHTNNPAEAVVCSCEAPTAIDAIAHRYLSSS